MLNPRVPVFSQFEPTNLVSNLWWPVSQPTALCTGLAIYVIWKVAYALYFSPLRNIPGPFLDRVTDLPGLLKVARGGATDKMLNNYERYGSMFIISSKMVVVCDPKDCRLILATHAFRKDMMYAHIDFLEPTMILTRDPELNKQRRRQVGPAFTLATAFAIPLHECSGVASLHIRSVESHVISALGITLRGGAAAKETLIPAIMLNPRVPMFSQLEPTNLVSNLWWLVSQPTALCAGLAIYVIWKVAYALYFSPLRNIPGPFLDRVTDLPGLLRVARGGATDKMLNNYEKYGSMFIISSKMVVVCDPKDCRLILATHAFRKDMMYAHIDFLEPTMILTRDPELNKQRRRQVGPAFTLGSLRKMESTILAAGVQQLLDKWNGAIEQSPNGKAKVCYEEDFTLMAFDVIGSLGFGKTQLSLAAGDLTVARWLAN
ncbi:cytochrome P450 [Martensiomyces pterosporus]|nr:cytochrome P450 [Martensiomyces pterosporus]